MSTQIKRLSLGGSQFVPITLSEAVVVNTSNLSGVASLGITTLDKVLNQIITNSNGSITTSVSELKDQIQTELDKKQNKLTAGTGITITDDGHISVNHNVELYKVVATLPQASDGVTYNDVQNVIYLTPLNPSASGNVFSEFIAISSNSNANDTNWYWEKLGDFTSQVSLSNYYTKSETDSAISTAVSTLETSLKNTLIYAENVKTSDEAGSQIVVASYDIPEKLYDNAVTVDTTDSIVTPTN